MLSPASFGKIPPLVYRNLAKGIEKERENIPSKQSKRGLQPQRPLLDLGSICEDLRSFSQTFRVPLGLEIKVKQERGSSEVSKTK
ncbi:hypothetical protein TNCT_384961 [Trichonephila clavata]|uniref:Uncharacterized protein n=1 Tax=Trichonephila clavata TaxID=2740835 RepID=A0A8X6HLF5_TRICU|nr:hypothetical protein TNCT_384961 [Trichonephila clavata]